MDEEVQERQPVTVGKPLVSKLNLHEPRPPRACSASSSFSLDSSVGSASSTRPYYTQTAGESSSTDSLTSSRNANIPEETDSPELCDTPK